MIRRPASDSPGLNHPRTSERAESRDTYCRYYLAERAKLLTNHERQKPDFLMDRPTALRCVVLKKVMLESPPRRGKGLGPWGGCVQKRTHPGGRRHHPSVGGDSV
jgi:hypothetical protein